MSEREEKRGLDIIRSLRLESREGRDEEIRDRRARRHKILGNTGFNVTKLTLNNTKNM